MTILGFDVDDLADALLFGAAIYFATIALLELVESPEPRSAFTDERTLRRLEDGETIRIPRWHGHDLVLRGELVTEGE